MPVQKTCGQCGVEFTVPNRRHETVKFCSIECKNVAKRVTLKCASCGKSFERPKSEDFKKYCSSACYHSVPRRPVSPDDPRRHQHHHCTCELCGAIFRVTLTRKDTARFCSRTCQSKSPAWRAECSRAQAGDKSWRWAGGLYKRGTGYVRERGPGISSKDCRFQHRLVVEREMLATEPGHPFLVEVDGVKKLDPKIEVHHFDRNRSNNEFTNLLAVTKNAHAQIHHRNRMSERWECWPYSHAVKMLSARPP